MNLSPLDVKHQKKQCLYNQTITIPSVSAMIFYPIYFKVSIHDGQVKVRAKRSELASNKRTKDMCSFRGSNIETVVIVGGGPSAATCAETLRQENFDGRIVMVCKEKVLPYDRVKVSKVMDFDVQKTLLRPQSFYDQHNIEVMLGVQANKLDTEKQTVLLSNCEVLNYTYLYIATGSKARRPDVPGADLQNTFVMRDYTDSEKVYKQLDPCKHLVVLGLGFIGLEAAAYCFDKVASVTVIGKDTVPLRPVFGEDIGCRIKKEFEEKGRAKNHKLSSDSHESCFFNAFIISGVKFISNSNICKLIPKKNKPDEVCQVELSDKTILPADIVIFGIGSTLYTNWLKGSGVKLLPNGCVEVDEVLLIYRIFYLHTFIRKY